MVITSLSMVLLSVGLEAGAVVDGELAGWGSTDAALMARMAMNVESMEGMVVESYYRGMLMIEKRG